MKKDIHPKYQQVLFVDSSTGYKYLIGSTLQPKEKETFEGVEYPVSKVPTSSASHPFFTGSNKFVDQEGRIDKFRKRYAAAQSKPKPAAEKETKSKTTAKKK